MRFHPLRNDLSLLSQGLALGWRFGLGSLEELARLAWEIEHGIYRKGSLVRTPEGASFPLRNPPLRIGAFRSLAVLWDGAPLAGDRSTVSTQRQPTARPLGSVTPEAPLELGVGEGSRFDLTLPADPGSASHRIRIEWRSVAVPPLVWLEFSDVVRSPEVPG